MCRGFFSSRTGRKRSQSLSRRVPQGRSLEIRTGSLKPNIFTGKYEAKLEFPGRWGGGHTKKSSIRGGGGMDIFWKNTILLSTTGAVYEMNKGHEI